jgi:hypothetical protein
MVSFSFFSAFFSFLTDLAAVGVLLGLGTILNCFKVNKI